MKKSLITIGILFASIALVFGQKKGISESCVYIKSPGNPAREYNLTENSNGILSANESLPLEITRTEEVNEGNILIRIKIKANDLTYYNYEETLRLNSNHDDCQFYMPGFWYHRNERSPKEAPSFHTSDSWRVREDRLSTPLTGIYDQKTGDFSTILRLDDFKNEALACHSGGEVILGGKTSLGFTGFQNINGKSALVFGYPYNEAPNTYIRKLTLAPPVKAFSKIEKGEIQELTWEIRQGKQDSYSSFIADTWNYSYDTFQPKIVEDVMSVDKAKSTLSNFFVESFVDKYPLKYYSGVHLRTDDCNSTGVAEVGFVGRVLLNAFNALEYGEANNREDLVKNANIIFESYLNNGFTDNGYFREFVNFSNNDEPDVYSIRRQSEATFAILNYLDYEKKQGRGHTEWERKINRILDNFLTLQNEDGSFPRKFSNSGQIIDQSGGSTPSATLPLAMASKYFNNKKYFASAKKTADYLEKELVSKSDYFSSTLDANCEDKEASLYASTAMYYMSMLVKGKEKQHYIDLCKEAAYFALSWYYMWDVPFAQGQMLGDVGFKSRGWGNVSVENNHIDVFIFEFATVLDWLAQTTQEPKFSNFSAVIKSSMLQLMPVENHMFNIAKVGYYPEVVQHTNWDYGKFGKGFYNDIFAPGWTVASLWQMMSPQRVENFFNKK